MFDSYIPTAEQYIRFLPEIILTVAGTHHHDVCRQCTEEGREPRAVFLHHYGGSV